MNKQLKISLDFDGVLGRTMSTVCDIMNILTGGNHTHKHIITWDYWQDLGHNDQFNRILDYFDREGRLMIKPYDEHIFTSLWKIRNLNCQVHVVTANSKSAEKSIWDWVIYNYGVGKNEPFYCPISSVNCLGRVSATDKLNLDYSIYIDDSPHLAIEAVKHPDKQILLANAPWNKNIKNSNNVIRFESWKEVPGLVKNIIKGNDGWKETLSEKCHRLGFKEVLEKYKSISI
jgi:uncharacterized HAD superfamily protein